MIWVILVTKDNTLQSLQKNKMSQPWAVLIDIIFESNRTVPVDSIDSLSLIQRNIIHSVAYVFVGGTDNSSAINVLFNDVCTEANGSGDGE